MAAPDVRILPLSRLAGREGVALEDIGYAALAALAALLRLVPASDPRSPEAAARAAAALDAARGADVSSFEISITPTLFLVQRLVFTALPDGPTAARLIPAVCGVATVLIMRRFAPRIGRAGAMAAAAIVAAGPLWIAHGRELSDVAPAALAALVVADAVMARRALALAVGAAFALALAGWSLVPTVAAVGAWAVHAGASRGGPDAPWPIEDGADSDAARRAAVAFGLAVAGIGVATALASRAGLGPPLLGGTAAWIRTLAPSGDIWGGYLVPLAVYAPLSLVFGTIGLARLARPRDAFGTWLALWAVLGLCVGLATRSTGALPEVLVPLGIGAGFAIGRLIERVAAEGRWAEDGIMIALVLIIAGYGLIHALRYADSGLVVGQAAADPLRMVYGSIGLVAIIGVALAMLWGRSMALRVLGSSALAGLAAAGIANGSWLNHGPSVELVRPERVEAGAAHLAADLMRLVARRDPLGAGSGDAAPVVVAPELRPILGWAMRDVPDVTWSDAHGSDRVTAIVLPADRSPEPPTLPGGQGAWSSAEYEIGSRWRPAFLDIQGFFRWYLQRRVAEGVAGALLADPPQPIRTTVYSRAD